MSDCRFGISPVNYPDPDFSNEWLLTFEKKAYKTSKQCDENGTGSSDKDNQGYYSSSPCTDELKT